MKMKKIINILAISAILASAVSCDLDLVPKGSLTYNPGQTIITSSSDLQGFEANIMASMRSLEYGQYDVVSDVMVDYFNATADYGNQYGPIHRTDNSFTSSDYDTQDNWSGPYSSIKNFNIFIEGAQSVPAELKEDAAVARGEAYFGRAFAYLHLARHFGKAYSSTASTDLCVPLVTVYDQNARPERATVAEVYAQIKQDLDSAAVLLASIPGEVRAQRPTIDAVNALYARYYIDTKDYEKAASSAMSVINTGKYSLSGTAEEMEAEWLNDKGNEPIMQYYASLAEGRGSHSIYCNTASDSDHPMYYKPYFIPTKKLVESYDEGDLRLAQWFNAGEYPSFHVGAYYNTEETGFQYYTFIKYFGNPDLTTGLPGTYQAIKPLLISEMYLIAAEAYLGNNDASSAKTVLNQLQEKRGAQATVANSETIENEWYRETVGEGLRMSCLKRWGKGFSDREAQDGAKDVISTGTDFERKSMAADDYHFCWPIPKYEMQTNLNLVQNAGYSEDE